MAGIILTAMGTTNVVTNVGTQLVTQSISMSVGGITSGIKYLFKPRAYEIKEVNDIKRLLKKLDIVADVNVVKTYLDNLKTENLAVIKAWENLNEVMEQIFLQIKSINKKVDYVESSSRIRVWWNGYPDFNKDCEEMRDLSDLFNKRFDLLKKILN